MVLLPSEGSTSGYGYNQLQPPERNLATGVLVKYVSRTVKGAKSELRGFRGGTPALVRNSSKPHSWR